MRYDLYAWVSGYKVTYYFVFDTIQKGTTPSEFMISNLFTNKEVVNIMEYINHLNDRLIHSTLLCSFDNYDDLAQNNPELFI